MASPAPPGEEPPVALGDPRELLDAYLDFYRDTVLRKLAGLTEEQLRSTRVPSGWTPLALLVHLTWVERRWFGWGFAAEPIAHPWGEEGPDGAWQIPDGQTAAEVKAAFTAQCARSRAIAEGVPLSRRAALGGRFATETKAPTLGWVMFHVLQEYARHAGHLDIARELSDGAVGE